MLTRGRSERLSGGKMSGAGTGAPRAEGAPVPFPWSTVLTLTLAQFTSAFSFTVLFPFVPFMIVDIVGSVTIVCQVYLLPFYPSRNPHSDAADFQSAQNERC